MKFLLGLCLFLNIISHISSAEEPYLSKYKGQENRTIKSLSIEDIAELKKGGGWGLAKAAELNGFPGPAHVLQMESKIDLTTEQKKKITKLYDEMKAEAIVLGEELIRLELNLNTYFSNLSIDQALLEKTVYEIENIRAKLRLIHLSRHLLTSNILTDKQISLYNNLRGYSKDPCLNVPQGHDASMWKKHNGCK